MQFWPPASRPQNRRLPWPEVTSPIFSMYWLLGNIFNKLYEPAEFEMMSPFLDLEWEFPKCFNTWNTIDLQGKKHREWNMWLSQWSLKNWTYSLGYKQLDHIRWIWGEFWDTHGWRPIIHWSGRLKGRPSALSSIGKLVSKKQIILMWPSCFEKLKWFDIWCDLHLDLNFKRTSRVDGIFQCGPCCTTRRLCPFSMLFWSDA